MHRFTTILVAALALFTGKTQAAPLAVGAPAPDAVAPNQDGHKVVFKDVYAKGITLVYFYPKAGTSGCTAEACSLRDSYAKLKAQGLQIIGVSRDTAAAQKEFADNNKLPFTLVADHDGAVAKQFGVPPVLGVLPMSSRQSFIVKDGKIAWTSYNAKTTGSAEEVQAALDKMKS